MQKHHFPLVTLFSIAIVAIIIIGVALSKPTITPPKAATTGGDNVIQEPQNTPLTPSQVATGSYTMPQQWYYREANFYKTELGDTLPKSVPVEFYVPAKETVIEGALVATGCIEQKISNGSPATGIPGTYELSFSQRCDNTQPNEKRLTSTWVEIGTVKHKADDGSTIHIVRIPGATSNKFQYVFVLKPEGEAVATGNLYTETYYVYPQASNTDTNAAVAIHSVVLTLNTQNSQDRGVFTAVSDKIVLNVQQLL